MRKPRLRWVFVAEALLVRIHATLLAKGHGDAMTLCFDCRASIKSWIGLLRLRMSYSLMAQCLSSNSNGKAGT